MEVILEAYIWQKGQDLFWTILEINYFKIDIEIPIKQLT